MQHSREILVFEGKVLSKIMSMPDVEFRKTGYDAKALVKNLYYKNNEFLITTYDQGEDIEISLEIPDQKEVAMQVVKLLKLVEQTENILKLDELRDTNWIGRVAHLEIERLLVISRVRMDVMSGILTLQVGGFTQVELPRPTKVVIENIQWTQPETDDLIFRQYCCVLSYGSTVYGSNVVSQRPGASMNFEGPYKFGNLSTDFKINVKFYSAVFDKYFSKRARKVKLPMMKLRAYAEIDAESLKLNRGIFMHSTDGALPDEFQIKGRIETDPDKISE